MSDHVTLTEFLNLTKLSQSDLINMLEHGELAVLTGPLGELFIDLTQVSPETIAKRAPVSREMISNEDLLLIEEVIASEVTRQLDEIVDAAVAMALGWIEHENER